MGRMNHTPYGPLELHLWLVGRIPPKTWENCAETSERKSLTHSCDDLVDLLIELAMERESDTQMDKYLRTHLRRENPAEKGPGGRSPQAHSNPDVPDENSGGCGIFPLGLRAGSSPANAAALRSSPAFFRNSPSLGWPAGGVALAKSDRAGFMDLVHSRTCLASASGSLLWWM